MKVNRNANKYIKDCKHFFPFLSKNEKIFLKRLKTNIIENIDSDNITYDDLCNEFGYPSDIIISYFEEHTCLKEKPRHKEIEEMLHNYI